MTVSSTIIRIFLGIKCRINEMDKLENASTKVSERLITTAVLSCTVTANAEQIPKICPEIGLLSQIGVKNTRKALVRVNFIV